MGREDRSTAPVVRGLSRAGFLRRLDAGKAVNCPYRNDGLAGLLSAWRHGEEFVLTWEECADGDQANENLYTRDERHRFPAAEALLQFLEQAGYPASRFGP